MFELSSPTSPAALCSTQYECNRAGKKATRSCINLERRCPSGLNFGPRLFSLVLDRVAQDAHPLDFYFEDIAGLHEYRWLARRSDATGCSGDDHIARL